MQPAFPYSISFPSGLHEGIIRHIALWRLQRRLFIAGFAIVCFSLGSAVLLVRFIGAFYFKNEVQTVIATLMSRAEYNPSYIAYSLDVLDTVLPLHAVAVALANIAVAVSMGWLMISFRKQVLKGRMFDSQ